MSRGRAGYAISRCYDQRVTEVDPRTEVANKRDVYKVTLFVIITTIGMSLAGSVTDELVHKYIWNGKTQEARHELRRIGELAVRAYQRDRAVCPSASGPVPADIERLFFEPHQPLDHFYQSMASEWTVDAGRNAGFACLGFELMAPQFYQYSYEATESGFVARARGDLDSDHVYSTFELRGRVEDGHLVVDRDLVEKAPNE